MNHTPNYNLSQWEKTDRVLMDDFNADNAKIDAAIKAEADARAAGDAALAAQLGTKGNCQVWTTTYIGNGNCGDSNPTQVTFPGRPAFAMIVGNNGNLVTIPPTNGSSIFHCGADAHASVIFTWRGNTVSWYGGFSDSQMNYQGIHYTVIAFYVKS